MATNRLVVDQSINLFTPEHESFTCLSLADVVSLSESRCRCVGHDGDSVTLLHSCTSQITLHRVHALSPVCYHCSVSCRSHSRNGFTSVVLICITQYSVFGLALVNMCSPQYTGKGTGKLTYTFLL